MNNDKFEVGEKVLIYGKFGAESVGRVVKITPTGRYKVEKVTNTMTYHTYFNAEGYAQRDAWGGEYLAKLTPEKERDIEIKAKRTSLSRLNWDTISDMDTEKVYDVLYGGKR